MDVRDRLSGFIRALPVAHRIGIVCAVGALAMLTVLFVRWVTTPSYTVLYSGMDDRSVATAIDQLESLGVPYRLEGGGSRILVPQSQLYTTRANLASAGVGGQSAPAGYELLDNQGLSVSDFRQRVDYQRALEGELARTLMAMEGVDRATVHLVVPEEELFSDRQKPTTASVLLSTTRTLSETEVEAVTFLVSSSVEGLGAENITVADARGAVLHAPGDSGGASTVTNRNMRQTREFEQALAADLSTLLGTVTGGVPASVVVRATLNFDEAETQTETFDPATQVALREQTQTERYEGNGTMPGGAVGVDGGPVAAEAGTESNYERDEETREYGVDRVTARTVAAPGKVERLSVAVVMDDGADSGLPVPPVAEVQQLIGAALQLDEERGDSVAVTQLTLPVAEVAEEEEASGGGLMGLLPQALGGFVLLVVSVALFLMSRRRKVTDEVRALPARKVADVVLEERTPTEPQPHPAADLQRDVTELVQRQPEEIATLLRSWLADRRSA